MPRCLQHLFEITGVVHDTALAGEVERMLEEDFRRSRPVAPGELAARPWWFRFGVRPVALTAPTNGRR